MSFEFKDDKEFFVNALCPNNEDLINTLYLALFDFRDPKIKRLEFNKIKPEIKKDLIRKYGLKCMLQLDSECLEHNTIQLNENQLQVDHIIPLSSNKLNKARGMGHAVGKKVETQSFGSNNKANLILSCTKCNATKKYKIDLQLIQDLLEVHINKELQENF